LSNYSGRLTPFGEKPGLKKGSNAQGMGEFMKQLCAYAIGAIALVSPAQSSAMTAAAAAPMSETQPDSIPAAIVADWKAQNITDMAKAHAQRVMRIKKFIDRIQKIVYAEHYDLGGANIGYTEDLNSDGAGNKGGKFPGTACMSKGSNYAQGGGIYIVKFKGTTLTEQRILNVL
jgi:hypothetical protein